MHVDLESLLGTLKDFVLSFVKDKDAPLHERLIGLAAIVTLVGIFLVLFILPSNQLIVGLLLLIGFAVLVIFLAVAVVREHEIERTVSIIVKRKDNGESVSNVLAEWFVHDIQRHSDKTDNDGYVCWELPPELGKVSRVKVKLSKQGGSYRITTYSNVSLSPRDRPQTLFIERGPKTESEEAVQRTAPAPRRRKVLFAAMLLVLLLAAIAACILAVPPLGNLVSEQDTPSPTATLASTPMPDTTGLGQFRKASDSISPVAVGIILVIVLASAGILIYSVRPQTTPKKKNSWQPPKPPPWQGD